MIVGVGREHCDAVWLPLDQLERSAAVGRCVELVDILAVHNAWINPPEINRQVDICVGEADFDGLWSHDYEKLPGLVGGHTYTNEEWQQQVVAQLDDVDVAVVDISSPSTNVIWEIRQCYDRLPSHRIILVASASALTSTPLLELEEDARQEVLWNHIMPIMDGLKALDANPTTKPVFLIYPSEVEGQVWLGYALLQAMSNIVAIESVE